MNLFNRKSVVPPPSPSVPRTPTAGPEAFANNSSYGRGFYEIGAYSVALKRCENGHDLAQDLATMFEERAQLELAYTSQLRAWSRKWHNELSKSQEYGTSKTVWNQAVATGDQLATVHGDFSTALSEVLVPKLRQWRKDHYEKSVRHYKKTKEFEKEFSDAQKSWNKLLEKISDNRSTYYSACKASKNADEAERNAPSEEQRKKLADKAEIARREINSTKTKYEQLINESREQRPRYEAAMKEVFEKTQLFEKKRLDFFKDVFEDYSKLLRNMTLENSTFIKMNEEFRAQLDAHDADADLTWWDQTYGTQTNNRWPEFEEYRE